MIVRNIAILSMLAALPFAAPAVEKESGDQSSTNQAVGDTGLQAKLKAEREALHADRKAKHAEHTKALNDTLAKDEPRVFEWDADRCRDELKKIDVRQKEIRDSLVALHSDPEITSLRDEIAELSREIAEKNQELARKRQAYARKVNAKSVSVAQSEEAEKQKGESFRELRKLGSLRMRIQTRLTKVTADEAKKAAPGAVPSDTGKPGKAAL